MAQMTFREARREDVPTILALLADDEIARSRRAESAPAAPAAGSGPESGAAAEAVTDEAADAAVWAAFDQIDADPRNELIVASDQSGAIVGTCQLTFTPSLSRGGAERMTIEAVRVRSDLRGQGIGRALMTWSLSRARERGCALAQLTTDQRRTEAHRFYASLGFSASHLGFKIRL